MRKAIIAGEIDIYPEYTGNAAFFFNKADDPVWKDLNQGYEAAKKLDYEANKIVWLAPAPANNTWAIAIRKEVADEAKLKTMSDFGRWVAGGGKVVLAGSAEFVNSAAALPAFQKTYGFSLSRRAADRAVGRRHRRHDQGRGRPDQRRQCGHGLRHRRRHRGLRARGAGGRQHVQPVYAPAPIIREAVLAANPKIAEVLKPVFESLSSGTLQELNARIQLGGEPAQDGRRGLSAAEGLRGQLANPMASAGAVAAVASREAARTASTGWVPWPAWWVRRPSAPCRLLVFKANRIAAGDPHGLLACPAAVHGSGAVGPARSRSAPSCCYPSRRCCGSPPACSGLIGAGARRRSGRDVADARGRTIRPRVARRRASGS